MLRRAGGTRSSNRRANSSIRNASIAVKPQCATAPIRGKVASAGPNMVQHQRGGRAKSRKQRGLRHGMESAPFPRASPAYAPSMVRAAGVRCVNHGKYTMPTVANRRRQAASLTAGLAALAPALFYGGLVRTKNMLSVLMQVFVGFSLITVLWCVYGYSLAFTEHNAIIGGLSRLFLSGTFDAKSGAFSFVSSFSKGTPLYELVYVAFQGTFAAITCCLILGSLVERVRFSAVLLFLVIWFTFSYCPIAHRVWYWAGPDAYTTPDKVVAVSASAGRIWQWGALDFGGGTVVHINAGVAGLVGAFVL